MRCAHRLRFQNISASCAYVVEEESRRRPRLRSEDVAALGQIVATLARAWGGAWNSSSHAEFPRPAPRSGERSNERASTTSCRCLLQKGLHARGYHGRSDTDIRVFDGIVRQSFAEPKMSKACPFHQRSPNRAGHAILDQVMPQPVRTFVQDAHRQVREDRSRFLRATSPDR